MNLTALLDGLKELARSLRGDLIDKRLWPIAALLAAAVVALPVYASLSSSSAPSPPAVAVTSPTAPVTRTPGAAAAAPQTSAARLGALHDPFKGQGAAATGATTSTTHTSSAGVAQRVATGATTTTPAKTGASKVTPVASTPVSTTAPQARAHVDPTSLRTYAITLSFGQAAAMRSHHGVARLAAYPAASAPVVQFLGVDSSARSALFLVWGRTTASGDGTCRPGQTACDIVALKPGETEFFDVFVPHVGDVQYELDLSSLRVHTAASKAVALHSHARQSHDGLMLVAKATSPVLAKLQYSTLKGVLVGRSLEAASSAAVLAHPGHGLGAQHAASHR